MAKFGITICRLDNDSAKEVKRFWFEDGKEEDLLINKEIAALTKVRLLAVRAIANWGAVPQERMIYEETAELIVSASKVQKSVCKLGRASETSLAPLKESLTEEIADHIIMLLQTPEVLGLEYEAIIAAIERKADRALARIDADAKKE